MNILLVYPEMPFAFWSMSHLLRMSGKKASYPPVGLLTVAAMLPQGWNKRLVDLNVSELCDQDLRWADYAYIGA
ncbi:MAG: B12-binding domain-containing radical SAM protein, partial [Gammaproteobacteria bacterium]